MSSSTAAAPGLPPPHDLEAEESILGACLLAESAVDAVSDLLDPSDFFRPTHGTIYRALLGLRADDTPISVITLRHELERLGVLDEIGGPGRVHELAALVPAASNVRHYARIVTDHARARSVLRATMSVEVAAKNGGLALHPEVIDELRTAIAVWEGGVEQERILPPIISARDLCQKPDPPDGDKILGPVLMRSSRTIVGADTGQGKTTFNLAMIAAVVNEKKFLRWEGVGGTALVIDLEQGERTAKKRLREAGLGDSDKVDIWLVPDGLALERDRTQRLIVERALQGSGYDIVLLDPHYKAHSGDPNEERDTKALMGHLDRWRHDHGFALILPTHARKPPAQGRPRLTIHDVASGSGAVVRGAELVFGLEIAKPGLTKFYNFKDRDGSEEGELPPTGEWWTLTFSRERGYNVLESGPSGWAKAPPDDIAQFVRNNSGSVSPSQIKLQFDLSDGALRDRREALEALGIAYRKQGSQTMYVADENLLVNVDEVVEERPPLGAYDEWLPAGDRDE